MIIVEITICRASFTDFLDSLHMTPTTKPHNDATNINICFTFCYIKRVYSPMMKNKIADLATQFDISIFVPKVVPHVLAMYAARIEKLTRNI